MSTRLLTNLHSQLAKLMLHLKTTGNKNALMLECGITSAELCQLALNRLILRGLRYFMFLYTSDSVSISILLAITEANILT